MGISANLVVWGCLNHLVLEGKDNLRNDFQEHLSLFLVIRLLL